MKIIHLLTLSFLMLGCSSCVFYASPVKPASEINKKNALLYGRFFYGHHFTEELNPAWRTTGLWIKNEATDRSLYIQLKDTNPVYAVQVVPGRYRIAGFVRSDNEHGVKDCIAFSATNVPSAMAGSFEARAGDQIYIGDFIWETRLDYPILHWKLKSIDNNFNATTIEFRQAYPKLPATPLESIFSRAFRDR